MKSMDVAGMELTDDNNNLQLYSGWNLAGFPSTSTYSRDDGLNNLAIGSEVDGAYYYDSLNDEWVIMGEGDEFTPGAAYWAHAAMDCLWDVPL